MNTKGDELRFNGQLYYCEKGLRWANQKNCKLGPKLSSYKDQCMYRNQDNGRCDHPDVKQIIKQQEKKK